MAWRQAAEKTVECGKLCRSSFGYRDVIAGQIAGLQNATSGERLDWAATPRLTPTIGSEAE